MELEQLLHYLAQSLGQETFELNEDGVLSLCFDDDIIVNLEPGPEGEDCHLYAVLCRLPADPESRLDLFEALMTANCFGKGTAGASFSLDEEENEILLGRIFRIQTTEPAALTQWLQDMISTMDIWRQRLPTLGAEQPAFPDEIIETGYSIRV